MRIIFVFCFIFLTHVLIKAQSISNGLYVNEQSDEFICLHNDTIQFRVCNYDAFGTFSIGNGKDDVHNRGIYHILASNSIMDKTSLIDRFPRNDSLIMIKVLYNDHMPIISAHVYINDVKAKKKSSKDISISDKNGQVILTETQINNYSNKELFIQIEALGYSTKKKIILERGYNYVIKSIMPEKYPFTVLNTGKMLIKCINAHEIEVEIWRSARLRKLYGKTKLRKVDVDIQCCHFLFDKDIAKFHDCKQIKTSNSTTASQTETISTTATSKDKEEIQKLIRQVLNWANSKNTIDLIPALSDSKNRAYIGIDLKKHKENLVKLKSTKYFASEFIENYNQIILTNDRKLRNKEFDVWLVGDLPTFGNNVDPWSLLQDVPYVKPNPWDLIEVEVIHLNSEKGELVWKWGKPELNTAPGWKEFRYKFKVVKENGKWRIAYLQGFDFTESTRRN